MRGFVYAIAALAAVGIMIAIATLPGDQPGDESTAAASAETTTAGAKSPASPEVVAASAEGEALTLDVPKMHCEFACFPKVKETLENTEGVEVVELAPQKEAGAIDNRQVIVTYKESFDVDNALAKLEEAGFPESAVAAN